jgi:hypothetical protein
LDKIEDVKKKRMSGIAQVIPPKLNMMVPIINVPIPPLRVRNWSLKEIRTISALKIEPKRSEVIIRCNYINKYFYMTDEK